MTRERLEGMRDRIIPWITHKVKGISLPNYSESDREKVREDLEELFDLAIKALEQEAQTFKWCTDCREYDQENHCCHRWSEVIRDTVEEIKQEYIERLDKIRAEIKKQQYGYMGGTDYEEGVRFGLMLAHQILDKYKAEAEG